MPPLFHYSLSKQLSVHLYCFTYNPLHEQWVGLLYLGGMMKAHHEFMVVYGISFLILLIVI